VPTKTQKKNLRRRTSKRRLRKRAVLVKNRALKKRKKPKRRQSASINLLFSKTSILKSKEENLFASSETLELERALCFPRSSET
jgi:hypothetical protein